jgi:CcmD family protein
MNGLLPLMLVPLLVWLAVWGYLWNLDGKVKRLQQEMARLESVEDTDTP